MHHRQLFVDHHLNWAYSGTEYPQLCPTYTQGKVSQSCRSDLTPTATTRRLDPQAVFSNHLQGDLFQQLAVIE